MHHFLQHVSGPLRVRERGGRKRGRLGRRESEEELVKERERERDECELMGVSLGSAAPLHQHRRGEREREGGRKGKGRRDREGLVYHGSALSSLPLPLSHTLLPPLFPSLSVSHTGVVFEVSTTQEHHALLTHDMSSGLVK